MSPKQLNKIVNHIIDCDSVGSVRCEETDDGVCLKCGDQSSVTIFAASFVDADKPQSIVDRVRGYISGVRSDALRGGVRAILVEPEVVPEKVPEKAPAPKKQPAKYNPVKPW